MPGAISGVFYGVLLLVFIFVLPGGVMDGIRRIKARVVKVIPNPSWLPEDHAEDHRLRCAGVGVPRAGHRAHGR